MDTDAAARLLAEARAELRDARIRVSHLEQVVDGLKGLLGASGDSVPQPTDMRYVGFPGHEAPEIRPRDAVLWALRRRPGMLLTSRSIYEVLESNGLVNPEVRSGVAAYDMALRRLADEPGSGVERDDSTNRYIYRPAPEASPSARYDGSSEDHSSKRQAAERVSAVAKNQQLAARRRAEAEQRAVAQRRKNLSGSRPQINDAAPSGEGDM